MEHVIMMHAKDNIAIVMAPSLAVGSELRWEARWFVPKTSSPLPIRSPSRLSPKGGQIVKYGEPVGIATADIAPRRARSRA